MTDDVDAKLDAIFNARSAKEAEAVRLKTEAEQRQQASLQEFLALKESLIRPTLEALAQKLNERGHKCKVYEIADGEKVGGNTKVETIGLRLLLEVAANYREVNQYPHLTMSVEKSDRQVQFFSSTMSPGRGGSSGGDGSIGYDALTAELINTKALKIIAEVYR
jgi:hypothetical protein